MNKETLLEKIQELYDALNKLKASHDYNEAQKVQILANYNATLGAKQNCEFWIAELDKDNNQSGN